MTLKDRLLREFGPGILGGATCGQWLGLLADNGFAVAPRYLPRATGITLLSLLNSVAAAREEHRYGAALPHVAIPPPLFVLGLWRSGTTHLHNLLARDRRFAYPSLYEALNPHTFLGGGRRAAERLDRWVSRRRAMDGMLQGAFEPVEEDVALAVEGLSSMLGLVFPRSRDRYWSWVTVGDGAARWRAAYRRFVARLTVAHRRPLVLKSPANTARIGLLLEMFPGARFVCIHRHPEDVFRSTLHALNATSPWWRLQQGRFDADWVIGAYARVHDAYFGQRGLVPAGRLCEVAFADLERDPLGVLERVYGELALPDFAAARPGLGAYVGSLAGYARNGYPALDPALRRRLRRAWAPAYAAWGYEASGAPRRDTRAAAPSSAPGRRMPCGSPTSTRA